jgi:hypothetical protein
MQLPRRSRTGNIFGACAVIHDKTLHRVMFTDLRAIRLSHMDHTLSIRSGDVIRAVAYFDVFRYPLTNRQIFRFLPRNSVTPEHVSDVVHDLVADGILDEFNEYYFLRTEDKAIVSQRKADELRAQKMMGVARFISWLLKQFPFTRAVFITGSLSKNVAAPDGDIDFLIVTARDRLWICKTILTLFRKIFLFGSHKYFCTNFYVSEHDYELPQHNRYAAIELLTTRVMWNVPAFMEYQRANPWARDFFPNCSPSIDEAAFLSPGRSPLQRIIEGVAELLPLSRLNSLLMNRFKRHWAARYPALAEDRREAAFRTSPNASTVWEKDYQRLILEQYRETLTQFGIEECYD